MVDRPTQGTNTRTIFDIIPVLVKPHRQKPAFYRDLYVKEGLSAAQIAERIGCSKTAVLENLRKQGIQNGTGRRTNPKNYRLHEPPFGFSKKNDRLIPNKSEIKVCRLIVELRERQGMSTRLVAAELIKRGVKNRRGKVYWTHSGVGRIYNCWNGKV